MLHLGHPERAVAGVHGKAQSGLPCDEPIRRLLDIGHGDGKSKPLHSVIFGHNFHGGDAHHLAVVVDKGAAGVAEVDGRAGLNDFHIDAVHIDDPIQRGDNPLGDGSPVAQRVSDGHYHVSAQKLVRVAEFCGAQAMGVHLQHRYIGVCVRPHQLGLQDGVIVKGGVDPQAVSHHMGICEQIAVRAHDDSGSGTGGAVTFRPERDDGGNALLIDLRCSQRLLRRGRDGYGHAGSRLRPLQGGKGVLLAAGGNDSGICL